MRIGRLMNGIRVASAQTTNLSRRFVHKGVECTPPMRFISVPQKIGMYMFIATVFLSYPTYVLFNLDNLRPRPENELSPEVQAEIDRREAARRAAGGVVASPFI
ncbi:unnamed protein product [Anisakis simplex]|uniref:Cytochrome c oxidase assembly factor 3 n=1 Tax=Anisakis simplex TaxID=6269 RepID=A0A0M3J5M5_ANISI|nr:unnamed protein product [Anisakis simplex]